MNDQTNPATATFNHQVSTSLDEHMAVWSVAHGTEGLLASDLHGGHHFVGRYADALKVARDHGTFSSATGVSLPVLNVPHRMVPLESDPPVHTGYRNLLVPHLGPDRVAALEPRVVEFVNTLLDAVAGQREIDFVAAFARPLPVLVSLELLTLPQSDAHFLEQIVEDVAIYRGQPEGEAAGIRLHEYMTDRIEKYADVAVNAADNIMSTVVLGEIDGRRLNMIEKTSIITLLLFGGFDTTRIALAAAMWWLATHPEDVARLRESPELMSLATEEFVRFASPGSYLRREVTQDTELAGQPLKAGDQLLVSFASANRDPSKFADPNSVVIDRKPNAHIGFGAGVHRCMGSFVAKLELRIALTEILKRYKTIELDPARAVEWQTGENFGLSVLPLIIE